ncbi:MAG: hypothetical protein ABI656_07670, partial [bacterium]
REATKRKHGKGNFMAWRLTAFDPLLYFSISLFMDAKLRKPTFSLDGYISEICHQQSPASGCFRK